MSRPLAIAVVSCVLVARAGLGMAAENPFDAAVLDVRPRVFIRADEGFEGLTIAKVRKAVEGGGEFAGVRAQWRGRPMGRALLWMVDGKREDLDAAVSGLKRMDASGGSWSDRGIALVQLAALFDWLYTELDESTRREMIGRIEKAADAAASHIRNGEAPFYYSRTPGALAGVALAGISLHGVSPKADGYLKVLRDWGVNDYFKAYQWVDGAATGATYTMFYTYVDLPSIFAVWWSATGKNPSAWLRENQAGWLDSMVRFNLWYMRPGFAFTDINDLYREIWASHDQFCQGLDIASYVTRSGLGRAWSRRWMARFGPALYHPAYAHNLIFRDPTLAPASLTDMPLAELFGRESCGYGFFRSDWPRDGQPDTATHVFFRMGDPMDVHGGVAAGEFQVFRHAPLVDRSGRYGDYDSAPDQYHRNCISTNVVLFQDPADAQDRGDQNTRRGLKSDHRTWAQWMDIRQRNGLDVATILEWKAGPGEARCRADLSRANPENKCRQWIRELVWLGNRHLVVLDVVETADRKVLRQWQLHLPGVPTLGHRLIEVANRPPVAKWADESLRPKDAEGRLFCQTLLPKDSALVLYSGGRVASYGLDGRAKEVAWNQHHLKYGKHVVQIDPGTRSSRTVFLNVLTAVDAVQRQPPAASYRMVGPGIIEASVDGLTTRLSVPTEWGQF